MEWTLGQMLFYGGLAGGTLTLIAAVIIGIYLKKSKKKLLKILSTEYESGIK